MLHITYGSNATFYVTTEEKRIDTSVASARIRLLFKFINDMTGATKYAYGTSTSHNDANRIYQRYTSVLISHNTSEDVFTGKVDFKPYGYWKYEIYEVSFNGTVPTLTTDTAPINESDAANDTSGVHGVVKGKVEEGKLYVTETVGSEQVRYTEHTETTTNYLYTN
jgi:hypothetical protein